LDGVFRDGRRGTFHVFQGQARVLAVDLALDHPERRQFAVEIFETSCCSWRHSSATAADILQRPEARA
jgi:hypothetical protein